MRPHSKLRGLMGMYGVKQKDLAKIAGCSADHIGDCLNYICEWKTGHMYAICDYFNSLVDPQDEKPMPYDLLHEFFPPKHSYTAPKWPKGA